MYKRIVVPLDGSDLSERALVDAKKLSRFIGAPIHLVRIVDFTQIERYGRYAWALEAAMIEPVVSEEEDEAQRYLAAQAALLRGEGVDVSYSVTRGRAARAIGAELAQGDVVVMASHGRGNISRWLLGSVTEELLRHSPVPVLLVKATPAVLHQTALAAAAAS
jgi:nucleotide-binding universal stress UspA family protein